jgi:hypothetical protein
MDTPLDIVTRALKSQHVGPNGMVAVLRTIATEAHRSHERLSAMPDANAVASADWWRRLSVAMHKLADRAEAHLR